MFSTTLASLAFLNSRQGSASSGVYNINGVLIITECDVPMLLFWTLLFVLDVMLLDTHNLICRPHSVPASLVISGLKQY